MIQISHDKKHKIYTLPKAAEQASGEEQQKAWESPLVRQLGEICLRGT